MIKVKKSLSLSIIVFLILSNVAFAEYNDPSSYEGKPIDESKEGKEYYREGQIIVYPATISSKEKDMMERFVKGEASGDEMRALAKERMGEKFSEEEFEMGLKESKERISRKETFSYEHEGYERSYYAGPSYEGYSKEQMIFGMVFNYIGEDIDPRDIKQYCSEPDKVAGIVLSKLKEKIGDAQKICNQFEEEQSKCDEMAKKSCSQLGTAVLREGATELEKINSIAYSCPVNKDAIRESCKKRNKLHMEQRLKSVAETCLQRFDFEGERLIKECERFKQYQICDKEKYINQCLNNFGVKKEDFDESGKRKPVCPYYPVPTCGEGTNLKTKTDAHGCTYYYCETSTACTQDVQQCPDGSFVKRVAPSCNFELCPTIKCPEPVAPTCAAGTTIEKKVDINGCVYYYCKTIECPSVQKSTCNADETLQAYYDTAGCITSYQCIRHQTACPQVIKPTCAEGQSLTTKYDDKQCIVGYECVTITTTSTSSPATTTTTDIQPTTSNSTSITGSVILSTYDDYIRHCENNWMEQQKICLNTPTVCDKETFIERCEEQEKKNYENFVSNIERNCEMQTVSEIKHAEQRCARIDEDRQRCFEQNTKRCGQMKETTQQCRGMLTEENLRKFIVEEVKKRCKFTDIIEHEEDIKKAEKAEIILAVLNTATQDDFEKLRLFVDNLKEDLKLQDTTVYKGTIEPSRFGDIKLLPFVVNAKLSSVASSERAKEVKAKIVAGQKAEDAASKLVSLRDSDVPSEYLYIIEDKASDVLDVSDKLEEIEEKEEQKGFGYKVRLFLGLAKKAEQEEIKQLGESKEKLNNSIETLTKLIGEIPSDVAKSVLKEQVESLKNQQEDIENLIKSKEKKAKGLLGLFG